MTAEAIISTVCDEFCVTKEELLSRLRERRIVIARHMAAYLLLRKLDMTTIGAGEVLNREHSTIIYSRAKIEWMLGRSKVLKMRYDKIITNLNSDIES